MKGKYTTPGEAVNVSIEGNGKKWPVWCSYKTETKRWGHTVELKHHNWTRKGQLPKRIKNSREKRNPVKQGGRGQKCTNLDMGSGPLVTGR